MKKIFNILLGVLFAVTVLLVVWAVKVAFSFEGTKEMLVQDPAFLSAIGANIMWAYGLFVFALAATIFCALFGMIKSPEGTLKSLISLVVVIAIVGISYTVANGHTFEISDISNGTEAVFERGETVLSDTSILVTYVAMGAAFVAAIASEVINAFK